VCFDTLTIDAVVLYGHANKDVWRIYTAEDSNNNVRVTAADMNDSRFDKKTIDVLILLGCNMGRSDFDYNPGTVNKATSNFASQMALGKHIYTNGVFAADGLTNVLTGGNVRISPNSPNGSWKHYQWNYTTSSLDISGLSERAYSISDLIRTRTTPFVPGLPAGGNKKKP
jgi:hypothetical protein